MSDSAITLASQNSILPSITYREYHNYVAKDDLTSFTKEFIPGDKVRHPKTGRPMKLSERNEIDLYATNEIGEIINAYYSEYNELLTNENGKPVTKLKVGDTLYTSTIPRRLVFISEPGKFKTKPLSAYDLLKSNLIQIKNRFKDVEDADQIIVTAENNVLYDKIVKIMDIARSSDFPEIQIAKLRES